MAGIWQGKVARRECQPPAGTQDSRQGNRTYWLPMTLLGTPCCLVPGACRDAVHHTDFQSGRLCMCSMRFLQRENVNQFSSVTQSCLTLCDPTECSTPGLPVHHQLLEPTQTHVHRVSDAIQPSHPLSSPSPPAFNLSQHEGLFK